MIGKGKYDLECATVRVAMGAKGVILIVFDGPDGNGAAAQISEDIADRVPTFLRAMADQMEHDHQILKRHHQRN